MAFCLEEFRQELFCLLKPCRSQRLNSDGQAWQQLPLPTKPCHWSQPIFFALLILAFDVQKVFVFMKSSLLFPFCHLSIWCHIQEATAESLFPSKSFGWLVGWLFFWFVFNFIMKRFILGPSSGDSR